MSPTPKCYHAKFETMMNLICLALGNRIRRDHPNRLQLGTLLPGQTDSARLGPLTDVWNEINHRVFSRVVNTCVTPEEIKNFSYKIVDAQNYAQVLKIIEQYSGVASSFLIPSFVYAEALREYALLENKHFVPQELEIGVGFILGKLRRLRSPQITHWDNYVLEISSEDLTIRMISRESHHVEHLPGSSYWYSANLYVV